jgi:hypothetical protein
VVRSSGVIVSAGAMIVLLTGCVGVPVPVETPAPEFAARQLAAVGLTVEDFGTGWALLPGDDGSGGGPATEDVEYGDPCSWVTEWLPDLDAFATHSWRMYGAGDDATFASDWIAAAAPEVDLLDELDEFREAFSSCEPVTFDDGSTVQITPGAQSDLGDAAFSYDAAFTGPDGTSWGRGEVHTVVCGPLWLHLSYVGYDPFVERDALLATLVDRASELGGC